MLEEIDGRHSHRVDDHELLHDLHQPQARLGLRLIAVDILYDRLACALRFLAVFGIEFEGLVEVIVEESLAAALQERGQVGGGPLRSQQRGEGCAHKEQRARYDESVVSFHTPKLIDSHKK